MELNVGDYVRTECGIAKIKSFETKNKEVIELDKDIMICNMDCYRNNCTINQVINSSPNIIDLIEVGDYVNNYYVEDITNIGEELVLHIITGSNYFQSPFLYNEDIKSVLTREQFEAMQYVVGEE